MKRNVIVSFLSLFAAGAIVAVLYWPYYFIVTITSFQGFDDASFGLYIIISLCMLPLLLFISGRFFARQTDSKNQNFISLFVLGLILTLLWTAYSVFMWKSIGYQDELPLKLIKYVCGLLICFIPSFCLWFGMKSQMYMNIMGKKVVRIPLLILIILLVIIVLCKSGYVYFKTSQAIQLSLQSFINTWQI